MQVTMECFLGMSNVRPDTDLITHILMDVGNVGFDSTTASTSLLIASVQVSFVTCKIPSIASSSRNLYALFESHGMLSEVRKTFMPVAPIPAFIDPLTKRKMTKRYLTIVPKV
ncbi:hypothetical protein P5673_022006 [Acropora cervicornis]|uniref:Uncharacterized protein n=1 Tax=Acropora cervicornis TaxID=6130 RepID=A0AAD9Q773_ACRCE|nr:hypothetical protein P5673_022006 [Acropora cervicornis]